MYGMASSAAISAKAACSSRSLDPTVGIQLAVAKEVDLLQRRAVQLAVPQAQAAAVGSPQLTQAPAHREISVD